MYSDSFAFHLPLTSPALQLFVYATRSRDDIRVQFQQQQQQHTFRHRGHLQSHIIGKPRRHSPPFRWPGRRKLFSARFASAQKGNNNNKTKKRRTNKTKRRQAKQIHKAHRSHRNRIRHEAERRENDQRKDTTVGPRELAEAEEQRRWVSQEKINNSSVFSPPTWRFLLLFEFKPTAGARFRCVVIILLVDYCTGNLGQGVVKHKRGKKKEPDEVNVI
jgi:hypothetical protein